MTTATTEGTCRIGHAAWEQERQTAGIPDHCEVELVGRLLDSEDPQAGILLRAGADIELARRRPKDLRNADRPRGSAH